MSECSRQEPFRGERIEDMSLREQVIAYVKNQYGAEPEYLWSRFPQYAIFRHKDNQKWFCLLMNVSRQKLGLCGEDEVDILNVKLGDPVLAEILVQQEGYLRGYHISRGNWISVLLDGTVALSDVEQLVDHSFLTTASKQKKLENRPPKEWIIPSNPSYFDIVRAFDHQEIIPWKQGRGIRVGDTVFLYVGAPVSAVLYRCKVVETGIPYRKKNDKVHITELMRIQLEKRYAPEQFSFAVLKEQYGIYAVRGPRGIPRTLSEALQ